MYVYIVEEVESGYKPITVKQEIAQGVEITIQSYQHYTQRTVIGVYGSDDLVRKVLAERKEQISKEYGALALEELPGVKDHIFFSYRVALRKVEEG